MTGSAWRYVRWWAADNRRITLVLWGPVFLTVGPVLMIASLIGSDRSGFLGSAVIFLLGLLAVFSPALQFRGKAKPWQNNDRQ